ncbi:MAG: hypothetical protein VYB72_12625, partial [Planctomycetota bacterium]|nr:hypothetical protein [Planctomycetota bacterium]
MFSTRESERSCKIFTLRSIGCDGCNPYQRHRFQIPHVFPYRLTRAGILTKTAGMRYIKADFVAGLFSHRYHIEP